MFEDLELLIEIDKVQEEGVQDVVCVQVEHVLVVVVVDVGQDAEVDLEYSLHYLLTVIRKVEAWE